MGNVSLNSQQVKLLDHIKQHPGATIGDLASVLKDCKAYTRNILTRLVLKGLIRKERTQCKIPSFCGKKHQASINSYFITIADA